MKPTLPITHQEIAARAYKIWERNGCMEGHDTDYWFRAERELQQEQERAEEQDVSIDESVSVLSAAKQGDGPGKRAQASPQASIV